MLAIPGVRIDRDEFLRAALSPHCSAEIVAKAIETTPARAGVTSAVIRKASNGSINWHRAGVSATSAASGLPGGWWLAPMIPADLTQYFWHVVVIVQKLAYLHGWPTLVCPEEIDDETRLLLTLFIGVMLGAAGATAGLTKAAAALAAEVAARLPRAALTKYAIYQVAKRVAKWIGVRITKQTFAEALGRVVPVVGGVITGAVTWVAFSEGTRRLHAHLANLPLAGGTDLTEGNPSA